MTRAPGGGPERPAAVLHIDGIHRHIGMGGDQLVAALAGDDWEGRRGDARRSRDAAERAGVPTLAVLTGGFSEQELRDAGAVRIVRELGDLEATPFG